MNFNVGERITVNCFEVDYNGNGVSRYNDLIVFTKGLLEDESALVEITKIKKSFLEAKIIKLKETNNKRRVNNYNLGSLDLYHVSEEYQLNWQIKTAINTFNKISDIDLEYKNNIIANEEFTNYRNKNVYHVLNSKNLELGMYDNNYNLVKINNFLLASNISNEVLNYINNLNLNLNELANNLKHIVIRTNNLNEVMIILVLKFRASVNNLIEKLIDFPNVKSIYLNISKNPKHILGEKSYLIYGEKYLSEEVNGLKLYSDDQSFMQVNTNIASLVYKTISNYVNKNESVIDAYSGVGGIGLSLINKAKQVYLLESNESSVNISKKIIAENNIKNAEVLLGDVLNSIDNLVSDVLIVDPPRSGLNKNFIEKIIEKDFKTIIYLSCDLKTQARDYNLLKEKYEILNFYPIKMFYQTTSIENLIILKRKDANLL